MDDDSSRSSFSSYRAASSFHHKREYDSDSDSSRGYTSKSFHHNQKNDLSQYDEDSDADVRRKSKHGHKKSQEKKRKVVSDSDDEVKDQTLYCICRSPRMSQFMIACDNCEEWFHGDCVKVTSTYSKKVEKYYCDACRSNDPSLEIVLKEPYASRERAKKEKAARLAGKAIKQSHHQEPGKIFDKENNFPFDIRFKPSNRMDSDEERDNYQPEEDDDDEDFDDDDDDEFKIARGESSKRKGQAKKGRPKKYTEKESKSKSKQRGKKGQSDKTKSSKSRGVKKNDTKKSQKEHHRRGKHKTHSDDEIDELKSRIPRHCFGPKCINSARKGSKYCSDECGIRLAKERLLEILPKRINDWQKIPCAADKLSANTLDEIKEEFKQIEANLKEIDVKQAEFDAILEEKKRCVPYEEEEEEEILENDPDTDYLVFCFCCPQDVPLKGFLKHTERCFNKIEASSTYVSSIEPATLSQVINRDVFCNFYHPKQGNYCRRLKVLCPEHFKETRGNEDEVCGCPHRCKDDPIYREDDNDSPVLEPFCRLTRKKCIRHYGWEKVWQGGLDMQRLRLLWKWEELQYRKMKCLNQMNTRHGVLNLLLNQTTISPDFKIDPIIEVRDE